MGSACLNAHTMVVCVNVPRSLVSGRRVRASPKNPELPGGRMQAWDRLRPLLLRGAPRGLAWQESPSRRRAVVSQVALSLEELVRSGLPQWLVSSGVSLKNPVSVASVCEGTLRPLVWAAWQVSRQTGEVLAEAPITLNRHVPFRRWLRAVVSGK